MVFKQYDKFWVRYADETHGPYDYQFDATAKLQMLKAAQMLGWPRS